MKTIIRALCASLLFAFFAIPAVAQTAAPQLVLPATDRLVVQTCFILWAKQLRPQSPVPGKDFWQMRKENLPPGIPGDIDRILSVFLESMVKEGFQTYIPGNCGSMTDDPGGGITARFAFSVFPPGLPSGSPIPILQTDSFMKVPGEARFVYVPAQNLGKPKEVAASISAAMQKTIGRAQPKPVVPEVKTD